MKHFMVRSHAYHFAHMAFAIATTGFVQAIESFPRLSPKGSQINFQGLGWGDEHEAVLAAAFKYATKYCDPSEPVCFVMNRNRFSRAAADRIAASFNGKMELHGI